MKNLNRLYWLKREIKRVENQIKELTVLKANAMSGMPSAKKVSSPVEQFVMQLERLTEKLELKNAELVTETERIEGYIEGIEDEQIRLIARMRFIDHMKFQDIGDELFMDRTTVSKKLNRYLEGEGNGKTRNNT